MKDRTLKSSEEYIKLTIENLQRDFETQVSSLQQNHSEAVNKWKSDPSLSGALEAAYQEELAQLQNNFHVRLTEVQEEINSLVSVNSQRIKQHIVSLQSKAQELFRFINQSAISFVTGLLLPTKDFFE